LSGSMAAHPRCEIPAEHGTFYWGDSLDVMRGLHDASVDAIIFSPPFDGGRDITSQDSTSQPFLDWFLPFFEQFGRLLRPAGCVAFELGGVWLADAPGKSMQHAAAIRALALSGWRLVQDFFWYNPQLIYPEPVGAARAKDSVTPIWVMSMRHDVYVDTGALERQPYAGFVRGNLLEFDTSWPDDRDYEATLTGTSQPPYIDRWPTPVPSLFIELLTRPGDVVLDPFAGTGATCLAAEHLSRRWVGIERNRALEIHVQSMFGSGERS
jgi:DNA methylase